MPDSYVPRRSHVTCHSVRCSLRLLGFFPRFEFVQRAAVVGNAVLGDFEYPRGQRRDEAVVMRNKEERVGKER